jgi:hypothetical protein
MEDKNGSHGHGIGALGLRDLLVVPHTCGKDGIEQSMS